MKRVIAAVLCLCAPVAWGADLDCGVTYVGTYTPAGLTQAVDVYDLSFAVDQGKLAVFAIAIGSACGLGEDPFQVGIQSKAYAGTPTVYDADQLLVTETFAWQSDSHFMIPGDWMPAIILPTETNDRSLGTYVDPYGRTEVRGLGGMEYIGAIPVAEQVPAMTLARIGVLEGTQVCFSADVTATEVGPGYTYTEHFDPGYIPLLPERIWQGSGTGGTTVTDPSAAATRWGEAGNWSGGTVPGSKAAARVHLDNAGAVYADPATVGSLSLDSNDSSSAFHVGPGVDLAVVGTACVGTDARGRIVQTGGSFSTGLDLSLGQFDGASGTYELHDGQLVVGKHEFIGEHGSGAFVQTGGTHLARQLDMGEQSTYQLSGGLLAVQGDGWEGLNGQSFTQTGGTHAFSRLFVQHGSYDLQAGVMTGGDCTVTRGEFDQYGGDLTLSGDLNVHWGQYHMYDGELKSRTAMVIDGGRFVQTGGSHWVEDTLSVLGDRRTESTYELSDGILTAHDVALGSDFAGKCCRFTQTGGTNTVQSQLTLAADPSGRGAYYLQGGVLTVNQIVNGPGQGTFSQTGGELHVQAMPNMTLTNDGGVISPGHSIGTMHVGGLVQTAGTLLIEMAGLGHCDQVLVADSAGLGGVVDVQSLSGYRPRDGDTFTILTAADPNGLQSAGNFATVASNITLGLPGGVAFSGAVDGAQYKLTFLGRTTGDANGDHKVDGGDLGLMGGSWMKGQSRPFPGDASRDDIVNGGDLALMGGNWMMTGKGWGDGDFNGDGKVDGGDLALMGGNWMMRLMAWTDGDFNGGGKVDGGDLALMGGNWMWTRPAAPPVGQALPEPTVALLLAAGGIVLWRRRQGG